MATNATGLYVHIPFCIRKCNYCDFCSFGSFDHPWREEYIEQLCKEIYSYKDKNLKLDSIFFGGGTPTLLTADEFVKIHSAISHSFEILPECEFTIEANPKTVCKEMLSLYRSCGVNRISMGAQSIHENELKILGRAHNSYDIIDSYRLIRECGFTNINLDLMYGIPDQTMDSFSATLDQIIDLSPEHISVYGLILEKGTPFYKIKDRLSLPSDDAESDMYYLAIEKLAANGYSHYEISNYSRPGYECSHNKKYWLNNEFIGVGLAAYSFFDGYRYGNTADPSKYLFDENNRLDYLEKIDLDALAYEYVMLHLRLAEGFSLSEYKAMFGVDFHEGREDMIKRLSGLGYLTISEDNISLTERGFYVSNAILTELI